MEFKEIFEMQKALDNSIHKAHNVTLEGTVDKKILALLVEIGEFANELKPFKYWKKDKSIDRSKVLEEFVDGIHFYVSLANYVGLESMITADVISEDQNLQLLEVYESVSVMKDGVNKNNLMRSFKLYMGVAKLSGVKEEEIMEHYISKNKVNFERIANNY